MTRPEYLPEWGSGEAEVAKDGYIERQLRTNDIQLKLRKSIQSDEQKKVTKHNESVCYGCMRRDYALASMYYCCQDCMKKRGTEALYTIVYHKPIEEICDFCGKWQKPFDTWQINCSLCEKCTGRMLQFHREYRAAGGKKQNPFTKKMRKKYGKDHRLLLQQPARTINI